MPHKMQRRQVLLIRLRKILLPGLTFNTDLYPFHAWNTSVTSVFLCFPLTKCPIPVLSCEKGQKKLESPLNE